MEKVRRSKEAIMLWAQATMCFFWFPAHGRDSEYEWWV